MTSKAYDLTISIVSYNTSTYLARCLSSIYAHTHGLKFEVIVVDNASSDGSPEMVRRQFPQVKLVANQNNHYFSTAHNQSLTLARGRYYLILNSDTEIPTGVLARLVEFLDDNPQVGAVGCREINAQGITQPTGSTFSTPWLEILEQTPLSTVYRLRQPWRRYRMTQWDRLSSQDVEVITGCFLLARRALLAQLGGFDEKFLLYYTENDLCRRIWQTGYRIHFLADCHYMHHGQRSTAQLGAASYNRIYQQDMFAYYHKHFGYLPTKLMQAGFVLAHRGVAPVLAWYRRFRFGYTV